MGGEAGRAAGGRVVTGRGAGGRRTGGRRTGGREAGGRRTGGRAAGGRAAGGGSDLLGVPLIVLVEANSGSTVGYRRKWTQSLKKMKKKKKNLPVYAYGNNFHSACHVPITELVLNMSLRFRLSTQRVLRCDTG